MFWDYKKYESRISESAEELLEGGEGCLRVIYEAFATENRELVQKVGKALGQYLSKCNTKQMIRISEHFREFTSLEWHIDWEKVDIQGKKQWFETETDYVSALILGSFHPNGYFREKCMEALEGYPDTLPYIMSRTNDWVKEIREKAYIMTCRKIEQCLLTELVPAIQVVEKLRHSGRIRRDYFNHLEMVFYQKIESGIGEIPLYKIHLCEYDSRKYIYRLLLEKRLMAYEQIDMLLEYEKHSFCKQILITGIIKNYHCSKEQIQVYLKNKNGVVRRRALEYYYSIVRNAWPGLENMLLDTNRGVREMAAFILQKHTDMSVLDFYIEHLKDENAVPAIIGLGENGGMQEGKLLLPFLETDSIKMIRATLEALGKTFGIEGYDIYMEYLQSAEPGITKSAYNAIRSAGIRYGAQQLYHVCINTEYSHVRKAALRLLLKENSWDRLPYLLELYGKKEFAELEQDIYKGILGRNMYGSISNECAEHIRKLLQEKGSILHEKLVKNILFDLKFVTKNN